MSNSSDLAITNQSVETNGNRIESASNNLDPDILLSVSEVSAILKVSAGTLSVWRCTNRYPLSYVKCGRLVRYRSSDVLDFIAKRTVKINSEEVA
jgi:predicted DNA-binding transcriptional regulator AlpA